MESDEANWSPGDDQSGSTRVAELLSEAGNACPELRRPGHLNAPEVALEVAVSFVVDSLGAVDPATIQVVQAPGMPVITRQFVPHIYAVATTARVDRGLPEAAPEFGSIIAQDVLHHVAGLRFRPGTRNGRPTRSSVLVACRSEPSG